MTGFMQNQRTRLSEVELSHWKGKLQDIPGVRLDRVQATREALQGNRYESEQILDELINKLSFEMGFDE